MSKKAHKLQTNFNAGILSPYMEGRPDVANFFNGMLTGRNILALPEGGWENTPGTRRVTSTKNNGYALQIPFQPTDETSFELEFGDLYIRFRKNGEPILATGSNVVANGDFPTNLNNWTDFDTSGGNSTWSTLSGQPAMKLDVPTPGVARREQSITTVIGDVYNLTFTVLSGTASVYAGSASSITDLLSMSKTPGTHTVSFTAVGTTTFIGFSAATIGAAVTAWIDDVTCASQTLTPYELVSPYNLTDLAELQGGQGRRESVDVLFLCCQRIRPKELVYGGDTNWTLRDSPFDPPPSFVADTDISGGTATLTPSATTGDDIVFTASSAVFLNGDVGRVIKYGLARALIITFTSTTVVRADILVAFPSTSAIPAGQWLLEGSPGGSTLDVAYKKPVGRSMTAIANLATFRAADLGKYIKTYSGLLKITKFSTSQNITVKILAELTDSTTDNPAAAPAGSWTLETDSWSDTLGWPTLNEFFQGRYALASNNNQRTTKWISQTNNLYNFAIGALATDAVEYTHRSGTFGKTKYLVENGGALYFADGFAEHSLKGRGVDEPIGGDTVPFEREESHNGAALMRPIHVGNSLLFLNWTKRKVLGSAYNFDRDAQIARDLTFTTRDLTYPGLSTHAPAYMQEPIPLIFWRRDDGKLLVLSFNDDPQGGNNGWTTLEMDGDIESFCVTRRNNQHILSLIVARTINGATVRYIEEMDRNAHLSTESAWTELQTQCAIILEKTDSADQTVFTGLGHLEGETVEVLLYKTGQANWQVPRFMGTFTVAAGAITLNETISYPCKMEVGLPLTPFIKTMRAAIPNSPTDGHLRRWIKCLLRLYKSSLPVVNGTDMQLNRSMDNFGQGPYLRSGDFFCDTTDTVDAATKKWGESLEGYVEITRNKPYPLRLLLLAGEIEISDMMGPVTNNEGTIHVP
jgi:hypothetical protein